METYQYFQKKKLNFEFSELNFVLNFRLLDSEGFTKFEIWEHQAQSKLDKVAIKIRRVLKLPQNTVQCHGLMYTDRGFSCDVCGVRCNSKDSIVFVQVHVQSAKANDKDFEILLTDSDLGRQIAEELGMMKKQASYEGRFFVTTYTPELGKFVTNFIKFLFFVLVQGMDSPESSMIEDFTEQDLDGLAPAGVALTPLNIQVSTRV